MQVRESFLGGDTVKRVDKIAHTQVGQDYVGSVKSQDLESYDNLSVLTEINRLTPHRCFTIITCVKFQII